MRKISIKIEMLFEMIPFLQTIPSSPFHMNQELTMIQVT
jgi:hypothetical protein